MDIASQIGLKAKKKMHKNHANRDNEFENYKYMAFYNPGHRIWQPFLVSSLSIFDFLEPCR